jgi:hypothetical protein
VSGGPAIAKLVRSYIADSRVIFPSGTMLYGEGRVSGSRFAIKFGRMVLPSKREVAFDGIAYDLSDRKPGLAATRRIAVSQPQATTGERVGKTLANTALTRVSGGLAEDAARQTGEILVNAPPDSSGSSGEVLLLDAGADLDVLLTKPL